MSDQPQLPGDFGAGKARTRKTTTRPTQSRTRATPPPASSGAVEQAPIGSPENDQRNGRRLWDALSDKVVRARPKTMLRDLYGRGHGNHRNDPDTAAAANALGVSRRTVQRWVQKGMPDPGRSPAGDQLRQQWTNSRHGRSRSVSDQRRDHFHSGNPVSGRVRAEVWISQDKRNGQERSFNFDLSATHARAFYDAAITGNDRGAYDAFRDGVGEGFGGDIDLRISDIDFTDRTR